VVTEEMLADLPEPVRRYLRCTGVVGTPVPGTIRLHQEGRMRPGPGPKLRAMRVFVAWAPPDAFGNLPLRSRRGGSADM
jgi:hypothetical protein